MVGVEEMEYEDFIVEKADGLLSITLNQPRSLNALDSDMFDALGALMDEAADDPTIGVVVITGAGRGFCSGIDVGYLNHLMAIGPHAFRRALEGFQDALFKIERLEKPVIAAINGPAAGGGFELALACDFRIGSSAARLGFTQVSIGLIPDQGGTKRLSRVVGYARAKELILTGRILDADEALRMGLLTSMAPPEELIPRARELARGLLTKAPLAVGLAKRVIDLGFDVDMHTAFHFETYAQSILHGSEDLREGVRAFMEKRPARFAGR